MVHGGSDKPFEGEIDTPEEENYAPEVFAAHYTQTTKFLTVALCVLSVCACLGWGCGREDARGCNG